MSNTLWIGWRLLATRGAGLRQAALVAFGVALGSSLLFAMASIPGAVADRQSRDAQRDWLTSGDLAVAGQQSIALGHDRLGDRTMTHLLISADVDPKVLGYRTEELGSAQVSPALGAELSSDHSLSGRIQGTVVDVLPSSFLVEPSELVSVSFVESSEVFATGEARVLPMETVPNRGVEVSSDVAFVVSVPSGPHSTEPTERQSAVAAKHVHVMRRRASMDGNLRPEGTDRFSNSARFRPPPPSAGRLPARQASLPSPHIRV